MFRVKPSGRIEVEAMGEPSLTLPPVYSEVPCFGPADRPGVWGKQVCPE